MTEIRRPRCIVGHVIAELRKTPSAEQNMGMPVTMPRRWTVDEVHALQEQDPPHRYEVVDGELLVSPGPRLSHQRAVFRMARLLGAYVEAWQIGEVSGGPGEVFVEGRTAVQPDLFVLPFVDGRVSRDDEAVEPLLVIEILSPSTAHHDRLVKRRLYQRKVVEYWILDLDARLLERWVPGAGSPEIATGAFHWLPLPVGEPFELDLPEFFSRVLGAR